MTQPIATGFPDWARRDSVTDAQYMSFTGVLAGPTTYGPFYVGDVTHIGIFLNTQVNATTFDFGYFLEETLTNPLGTYPIELDPSGVCSISGPVRGPWLSLNVNPSVAGTNVSIVLWSTGANAYDMVAGAQSNVIYSIDGQNIAAGATVNFDWPGSRPGPAYYTCHLESGVSYRIKLYSKAGATFRLLDYATLAVNNSNSRMLILPPTPLRITVTNLDGVLRNLYASLVSNPLYIS